MNRLKVERNIRFFYLFQLLREPLFWGPVMVIYINRVSGMGLSDIYFMEAIVLIFFFLMEIPSGAIADLLGRRRTMLIGYAFLTLDNLIFSLAVNPIMVWAANLTWAFGFSLVSGADSALLYDSLLFLNRARDYKKIYGRADSYRLVLISVCSIGTGYLATINIRLPIILSTVFIVANVLVIYFFAEPPVAKRLKYYDQKKHVSIIKEGFNVVFSKKKLLWIIVFVVLVQVVSKLWFFSYNMYFDLVSLPLVYFGWIFFLLNLVAAASSRNAHRMEKIFGEVGSMLLMVLTIAIPLLLMSYYVSALACLLVLWQNISRGYIKPFADDTINSYVDSKNRATAISIKSAAAGIGQFVGLMLFSYSLDIFGLIFSLKILGWFALIFGLALVYCFHKRNGKK